MSVKYPVSREGNVLTVHTLNAPHVAESFLRVIYDGQKKGYGDFELHFPDAGAAYPNACTPIAGLIDYYRTQGFEFYSPSTPDFVRLIGILNPLQLNDNRERLVQRPLNTIWAYSTPNEVNELVTAFLREVSRTIICETGVIQGLEWCLNEVLDNVLQHADASRGFVMGQIHQNSKHIAICVFDCGKGIFNSLKGSTFAPRTHLDAITMAIKEGVTRDRSVGQGNGMWGLYNIVMLNSGRIGIASGSSSFRADSPATDPYTSERLAFPSRYQLSTTVDFQLDYESPIAVSKALGGHEPVNLAIEEMEDEVGRITFPLSQKASGTGTRISGAAIRHEALNLLRQSGRIVVIDFADVAVVSSSFADEFIGKLVGEIGFTSFVQSFRLQNLNEFVQAVINRAVAQRLGYLIEDESPTHELPESPVQESSD